MMPKIGHYLNRTVMISIPALFEDGACRSFTLLGVELHGLWLQSEELRRRLLPRERRDAAATVSAAVFVPFAQIAGVLVAGPASSEQPQTVSTDAAAGGRRRAKSAATDDGVAPKP
jgi:hypothetical protein